MVGKNNQKPDAFSTIEPLNHVLKIVGLSSITRNEGKIVYSWSNCKLALIMSLLFVANVCNIYLKCQTLMSPGVINFNNTVQLFYMFGYFQYIIDVYFVWKYRKDYVEYYLIYEYIDRVLGMPRYSQIRRIILKMCTLYIFSSGFTTIVDFIATSMSIGWILSSVYSVDYIYDSLKVISSLDTISHVTQIKYRIKMIGDSLEVLYKDGNFKLGSLIAAKKRNSLDSFKIVCYNHSDVILWFRRCYLLLLEQCDFFNDAYGFRVLAASFMYLFGLVILMNLMIRQMMGTVLTTNDAGYLTIASNFFMIVTSLCMLLNGMNRCEQNYRETERIIRMIDDLIINKKTGNEDREALTEWKNLIITRPVNFKAMNFYRLDYPCFISMATVIVMYTVIMLQSLK